MSSSRSAQHAASSGDVAIDGRGVAPLGENRDERGNIGIAESVPGKAATVESSSAVTAARAQPRGAASFGRRRCPE
jgi:hypothetical protein